MGARTPFFILIMNEIDILNVVQKKKIDYPSLLKELNIVTNSGEANLKANLDQLLSEGKIGLIDSKYFIMLVIFFYLE